MDATPEYHRSRRCDPQGILGGLTVLYFLPPAVSTAHATLGQTFFSITVIIVIFTGRTSAAAPNIVFQPKGRRIARLALISVGVLYVQLILGGLFRHGGLSWWPHVANSTVVIAMLTWTTFLALSNYKDVHQIRKPAQLILILLMVQVCLGSAAFYTRVLHGREALQPQLPMVISTVAPVGLGALLLATTVVLTIRAWLPDIQRGLIRFTELFELPDLWPILLVKILRARSPVGLTCGST